MATIRVAVNSGGAVLRGHRFEDVTFLVATVLEITHRSPDKFVVFNKNSAS